MKASRTLPLEVACSGVSSPTQLCVATALGPRAWSMLTTKCDRRTAMLTVSPSCAASSFADRPGLLGDVQLAGHRAGQPQDAEAEPVFSAVLGLLDQFALLQRGEQPERRRLVHADVGGDLADAGFTALGQDLQHADGAVDRLHTPGALTSRVAHNATIRDAVAHRET